VKERLVHTSEPSRAGALIVFSAFAVLYVSTAANVFLGGDSGLFALIYADGGYAHAPGYPLYSAYLRVLSWVPAANPAHGASMATAVVVAAAVAVLYAAARRWGLGRVASLFGAVSFGLARHVWTFHSQPEVFALNHLLAAAIVWAAAPRAPVRGARRVALLGLLAGLGLSHHHPIVLIAPVGLWAVVLGLRESNCGLVLPLAAGSGALLVGLLPYSYLLAVEHLDLGWHWRDPQSVGDLVSIFLRRDFGTFQLLPDQSATTGFNPAAFWAREIVLDLHVVPVVTAAVGLVAGCTGAVAGAVDRGRPTAAFSLCLAGALVATGPVFASLLPREPEGVNYLFLRRFHLFSELHVAFLAAMGAHVAVERWVRPRLAALVVVALATAAGYTGLREVHVRHDPAVENYIEHTFEPLPKRAIVVGSGDHHFFGAEYLQRGLHRRRDLDYVGTALYDASWYRDRLEDRLGLELPRTVDGEGADELVEQLLSIGRPVFATGEFREGLFDRWTVAPYGTIVRLYPSASRQPSVARIFRANRRLYTRFAIVPPEPPPPPRTWARDTYEAYSRHWEMIAEGLDSVGHSDLAARSRDFARTYAPWRSSTRSGNEEPVR